MLDFKKGSIVHLTENTNGLTKGTPVKVTKLIRHNAIELYEVQYQKNEPFLVVKCFLKK
jgi:hypothetical protein